MHESAVPILVVQEGQLAGKRWPLNRSELTIGRGEDCDIVLPDRQVSRHHFRVVRDDDGYNVEDLGSKNGTYINGAPVRGSLGSTRWRTVLGRRRCGGLNAGLIFSKPFCRLVADACPLAYLASSRKRSDYQ